MSGETSFLIFENGPETITQWEETETHLIGRDVKGFLIFWANKEAIQRIKLEMK